ncbi:unnamed protein product [Symbiodinium sp. CCMP2592]|nr:unnamed protein product [Symbiodinium sp. CCMP2592]
MPHMPTAAYRVGCPPAASHSSSSSKAAAGSSIPKDKTSPPSSQSRRLRSSSTPPKTPRPRSTQPHADPGGEYYFDLKLEEKGELEAVNVFARCLTGVDDMSKEVFYEVMRTSAGFQATLRMPAWSLSKTYEGEVMPNEKRAKQSAASVFKTDPDVLERSRKFPKGVKRLTNMAIVDGFRQKRRLAQETRNQHAHA